VAAGDIMDEAMGDMNVYKETTTVAAHFFLLGQLPRIVRWCYRW
jgi:hypothetical protein